MSLLEKLNLGWGARLPVVLQTEASECGLAEGLVRKCIKAHQDRCVFAQKTSGTAGGIQPGHQLRRARHDVGQGPRRVNTLPHFALNQGDLAIGRRCHDDAAPGLELREFLPCAEHGTLQLRALVGIT